jgi:hypothetical protein
MPPAERKLMTIQRWDLVRSAILALLLPILGVTACAQGQQGEPQLRPEQALCQKWGYEPSDPACLALFRRIAP